MNDLDKKAFAEIMVGNGEMYNKEVSKSLMQIYFDTLIDYSIDELRTGFREHSLESKYGSFFPKPADIIRHLQTNVTSSEEKALLAWNQIIREMRRVGAYGSLKLDDKQALAAIKAVKSWKDLCAIPEKDLTWAKKEFLANYKVYDNTPLEALPSSLPGLAELHEHKQEDSSVLAKIKAGIPKTIDNKERT